MKLTRLTIEVEPSLKYAFKAKAASEGMSIKKKIVDLIEQYLRKK